MSCMCRAELPVSYLRTDATWATAFTGLEFRERTRVEPPIHSHETE